MSSLLLALQGPVAIPEQLLAATLRSIGVLGTASPIFVLAEAVFRELAAERASRLVRALVVSLLVLVGAGAAGYTAVAAGLTEPGSGSSIEQSAAGSCGGCRHSVGN
jgi:hypothetical protein